MTVGLLSIGDDFHLYCLSDKFYVLSVKGDLYYQCLNQDIHLSVPPDVSLWIVQANSDNLGTLIPLAKSPELTELIRSIVGEMIK